MPTSPIWDFTDPDSPRSFKSRSTSDEPTFCTCSTFRALFCFKSWLPFLLPLAGNMCTAANTSLNFVTMPLNSVSVVGMVKHRYRCFSLLFAFHDSCRASGSQNLPTTANASAPGSAPGMLQLLLYSYVYSISYQLCYVNRPPNALCPPTPHRQVRASS